MYYQMENFTGIYDFRCGFHNGFIVDSHIHEYSELLYCKSCKGESCTVLINGRTVALRSGEFIFIPPNHIHQYSFTDADVICAVFSNDFIPLFFKLTRDKRLTAGSFNSGELKGIFEKLPELSGENKNNILLTAAYLNLICDKVVRQGVFENASPTDGILYQKVISYISDSFREDISLEKIAATFGYNKKYLSSLLHSLTGVHFSDFVAMYRIEYAKKLLIQRECPSMTEIAIACGFSAVNTFNRQFKRITAMTPTEYKRLYAA